MVEMPYLIGVGLALAVCVFASWVGLDRDRAFYPTVTIVVASYYALFATMAGSTAALSSESAVILLFLFASVLGFKKNMWIIAGALCAHGVLDSIHSHLIANPGVPPWWPAFCMAYDLTAGCYLGVLLVRSPNASRSSIEATR
jgi:hypothetical protein